MIRTLEIIVLLFLKIFLFSNINNYHLNELLKKIGLTFKFVGMLYLMILNLKLIYLLSIKNVNDNKHG